MGKQVDENRAYPKFARESECKPVVGKLAEDCKTGKNLPDDAPASLKAACRELEHLVR